MKIELSAWQGPKPGDRAGVIAQVELQLRHEKANPPDTCPCGSSSQLKPFSFVRMWNPDQVAAGKGPGPVDGIPLYTILMCDVCYERFLLTHCVREA